MKIVIDAVNETKGEWTYPSSTSAYHRTNGTDGYWYYGESKPFNDEHVCTREEFNQCVSELSRHASDELYERYVRAKKSPLVKGIDAKPVTSPTFTQAMADAGEFPSVGSCARLRVSDEYFINRSTLAGQSVYITSHFKTNGGKDLCSFVNHEESDGGVAAACAFEPLTPPIELINRGLYYFDIGLKTKLVGEAYFTEVTEEWMINALRTNSSYEASKCTNIQLLEVKSNE